MDSQIRRILIQLDSDPHPSVFDGVVAVDAGVDDLFRHGGTRPEQVRDLVHGAIFTRGPKDLHHTAMFVGGSNVADSEALLDAARDAFFGPMRVSIMLDANGSNTTAAAAVLLAGRHGPLRGTTVTVLAGTGPVGRRVARLLAGEGADVRVGSRSFDRAQTVCEIIREQTESGELHPFRTETDDQLVAALEGTNLVISAGTVGVQLLSADQRCKASDLKVAIDLNAVPPVGIEGIEVGDHCVERSGVTCYGAIGVGSIKMKIHKAALRRLFSRNDLVLDAQEIYNLAADLQDL